MIPLRDCLPKSVEEMNLTESHIENLMFGAMKKSKRFVLMKPEDEPVGEGLFLYPQFEYPPYRMDFYIKAIGYKGWQKVWPPNTTKEFCIECDGAEFHTSDEQKEHDRKRDAFFKARGIETIRYTGSEIYKLEHKIAIELADLLESRVYDG